METRLSLYPCSTNSCAGSCQGTTGRDKQASRRVLASRRLLFSEESVCRVLIPPPSRKRGAGFKTRGKARRLPLVAVAAAATLGCCFLNSCYQRLLG